MGMPGILTNERASVRQLEIRKIKPWRHGAARQRIFAAVSKRRTEPVAGPDDGNKRISFFRIFAQPVRHQATAMRDLIDQQGVTGIEMPDFIRGDSVKSRELSVEQQKIDVRGS